MGSLMQLSPEKIALAIWAAISSLIREVKEERRGQSKRNTYLGNKQKLKEELESNNLMKLT